MWNFFKNISSAVFQVQNPPTDNVEDESDIVNAINSVNLGPEERAQSESEEEFLGESEPTIIPVETFKCVHKTGKVTYLSEEYGLIDYCIHFVPSQVLSSISLKQNDEVIYMAYRAKDNESERVYKIYALKNDFFANDTGSDLVEKSKKEEEVNAIVRDIPGRVTKRKGRDMYIDTIDTWCNLDKIKTSFVPVEGDWVAVQAAVTVDEDVANFVGDIMDIKSIKPLIKKSSFGRITLWSIIKREGAIENSVYFSALECENGYAPSLGDQVVYDAIESDQGDFKWRALMVYPYNKNPNKSPIENDAKSEPMNISDFSDKNGISISPTIFAVEVALDESKVICFKITNNSSVERRFKNCSLVSFSKQQLSVSKKPFRNCLLKSNQTVSVYLSCKGKFLGYTGEICIFRFEGFSIARKIEINVLGSKEMEALLNCNMDNLVNVFKRPPPPENRRKPDLVLTGPKPWQHSKFVSRERKFHTFLYLEELELLRNFRKYNKEGVILYRRDDFFSLKVPGLAERRPSIIMGDSVILTQPWSQDNIEHVGFVFETLEDEILIKFHGSFHDSYDESECNIKFQPNTFFFSRCHEAVKRAETVLGGAWLFPSSVNEKPPQVDLELIDHVENTSEIRPEKSKTSDGEKTDKGTENNETGPKRTFKFFNKHLNERQKLAVVNVLKGQGRPLPYIIFGPPGTGKTVTLVEIILQIYFLIPESRILVTTPSNSAADLICARLIEMINIKPGQLIRLTAVTRIIEGLVPVNLRPYTTFYRSADTRMANSRHNENIRICALNELTGKHRITVSTCSNIGRLHFSGFPNGHFTHILVDEAGQTIEPEVLIAATFQNIKSGQVVLAGDPQQLGPTICSKFSKTYGFGQSLLERFTKTFPYTEDMKSFPDTSGLDPRFITKLNVNYRTVPEILALSSQMFYCSNLIPTISETDSEEADIIKKFNFMGEGRDKPAALIFHGIIGKNYQECDSPSWFNPHEVWQVTLYLKKLYSIGLQSDDVGILTPYAKQVGKLLELIHSLKLAVPKIGTVEEFQGTEKKVIILSPVRSSLSEVKNDIYHHLGFIACPKRLNVSLTRARALLIIVGNPVLLSQDPYWVTVLKYCIENKSYTGCNLKYFNVNLELELKEIVEEEEEKEEEGAEEEVENEGN